MNHGDSEVDHHTKPHAAGARMTTDSDRIDSQAAPEPVGAYPHARRAGNLLFLSGVGPRKRASKDIPGVILGSSGEVVAKDIDAQCRSCFDNVKAIVADAGVPWTNVVDVLVFLTDMKNDFKAYNEVYAEYFAGEGNPNPTRTTIEINALPTPIAVEVKVVATID
jgi:2-aminomuconate deaminase